MPNVLWYIIIAVISSYIFIYTIIKSKDRAAIVLYTFLSGLTYLFEFVILVLFKSYFYDPDILKIPYFDNIVGAIASNAFTVPMVGTFVGVFQLSWKWILIISGIFLITEEWFLHLHIYYHFWWRNIYTTISLIACFMISKKSFIILHSYLTSVVRFISLFFTMILLQASIVFFLVAIFGVYHYSMGWFQNPVRDHIAFATTYITILSFIFSALITFRVHWVWKIIVVILLYLVDWHLLNNGVLHLSNHWHLFYFSIMRLTLLGILEVFNRYFLEMIHNKNLQVPHAKR